MSHIPHIESSNTFTFFTEDGKCHTITRDNPNYSTIVNIIKTDPDNIQQALSLLKKNIVEHLGERGLRIDFNNYDAFFNGTLIRNQPALSEIYKYKLNSQDSTHIQLFLEKLLQNPIYDTISDLFNFVKSNNMPITADGDFLAYKVVNWAYTSANNTANNIGELIQPVMSWENVDSDRNNTCSRGYHFCSWEYITSYFGDLEQIKRKKQRILVVKVNPNQVAAIPTDYNESKGRAITYMIHSEYNLYTTDEEKQFRDFLAHREYNPVQDVNYLQALDTNSFEDVPTDLPENEYQAFIRKEKTAFLGNDMSEDETDEDILELL
jgi:hypothetical protein